MRRFEGKTVLVTGGGSGGGGGVPSNDASYVTGAEYAVDGGMAEL